MKTLMVTIVAAAVLLLMTVPGQAQMQIVKGAKVGLNLATFNGGDSEGIDTRTGFAGGGFVRFGFTPQLSVQPEVLYVMKGGTGSELGVDITFKMDYIEVPVLLRVDIPTQSTVTPLFFAGPAVGFNITSKIKGEGFGGSAEVDVDNAKSVDFGLVFGGGVEFLTGEKVRIGIEGRYTLGLSGAYDDVDNPGPNDLVIDAAGTAPDIKNGAFGIMATVGF